jgi:hypothetical protein
MRTAFFFSALVAAVAGFAMGSSGKGGAPKQHELAKTDDDPRTKCQSNDCTAPAEWFPKTPPLKDTDFPKVDADECDFYKFAWHSFLYLTQSENDGDPPRFILLDTPNELFETSAGKKLRIAAAPARAPGQKRILSLAVRNAPGVTHNVQAKAIAQAGSQGVVVDRNNRCLYYGQHINGNFVTFIRGDKTKGNLGLTTADEIKDVDPSREFPAGCVELKSAWRVLTDDEKKPDKLNELRKSYLIMEALVPTLVAVTTSTGKAIKADDATPRSEMVALVALHVVGTTPGHPEFVWASFEHVDNSPTQLALRNPTDSTPVDGAKGYAFYRQGTATNASNVNPVPDVDTTPTNPLTLLDANKQMLSPIVDIFREFNSGDDFIAPDDDVCTLNGSARSKLAATSGLSVWSNYQLIGAVWLKNPGADFLAGKKFPIDPSKPRDMAPNDKFVGEIRLSNSTMETFTQHKQFNCFGCHNTFKETNDSGKELPGLKIKVSHVIRNAFLGPQN